MPERPREQGERVHKYLAARGWGSRRQVERWIADGEVRVNGQPVSPGDRVRSGDRVTMGRRRLVVRLEADAPRRILAYHKPEGEVVSRSDPQGRPTVFARLPPLRQGRWVAVGRLDINTSGLLLLTNDGELANGLMHPSRQVEREYAVRALGEVTPEALERLVQGVELDDGPGRFEHIVASGGTGANRWYHVVITEGRKREVRRLWEAVGVRVSRLIRVRYGPILLPPRLVQGRWRELGPDQDAALLDLAGLKQRDVSAPPVRRRPRRTARPRGPSR
ncbi:MAG: pseudouridine synthase [Chromatiales bacterium]|jgi:23S rRNA pseudouridine2605 synthase